MIVKTPEIDSKIIGREVSQIARQQEVETTVFQSLNQRVRERGTHIQNDPRISPGELLEDLRNRSQNKFSRADPQFPDGRVGQEFDVPNALSQLIEGREAAPKQRVPVHSGLDTPRASVKKFHADCVFEIGNNLRHCWSRNAQLRCSFGHAANLRDGEEHVQIAKSQAAANLALPVDLLPHWENSYVE